MTHLKTLPTLTHTKPFSSPPPTDRHGIPINAVPVTQPHLAPANALQYAQFRGVAGDPSGTPLLYRVVPSGHENESALQPFPGSQVIKIGE